MAGRHKNSKRGARGTGKPDPTKDRTLHEAARGQKAAPAYSLTKIIHIEPHIEDALAEIENQSDRGAALIAAALVETHLGRLIRTKLVDHEDLESDVFDREGAPLASFAAKIKMARALGAIGPVVRAHLDGVRRIRNLFAHSVLKIDFTHPAITEEIEGLLPDNEEWNPSLSVQRRRYLLTAYLLGDSLETRVQEHRNDRHDIWLP